MLDDIYNINNISIAHNDVSFNHIMLFVHAERIDMKDSEGFAIHRREKK